LRLAVKKGAYQNATDGEPDMRDRCELRDGKLSLGTPVWYSFEMRIERGFPEVDARHVSAQMKAHYYDENGGSPLLALGLERGLLQLPNIYTKRRTLLLCMAPEPVCCRYAG